MQGLFSYIANPWLEYSKGPIQHDYTVQHHNREKSLVKPVVATASTASTFLCRADSVPIVMSVPQKSLSTDPTSPAQNRINPEITPKEHSDLGLHRLSKNSDPYGN